MESLEAAGLGDSQATGTCHEEPQASQSLKSGSQGRHGRNSHYSLSGQCRCCVNSRVCRDDHSRMASRYNLREGSVPSPPALRQSQSKKGSVAGKQ
jgi:hypothetical protein